MVSLGLGFQGVPSSHSVEDIQEVIYSRLPTIYPFVYHPGIQIFTRSLTHPSTHPPIHPLIHPLIHPPIHSFIHPSIHLYKLPSSLPRSLPSILRSSVELYFFVQIGILFLLSLIIGYLCSATTLLFGIASFPHCTFQQLRDSLANSDAGECQHLSPWQSCSIITVFQLTLLGVSGRPSYHP